MCIPQVILTQSQINLLTYILRDTRYLGRVSTPTSNKHLKLYLFDSKEALSQRESLLQFVEASELDALLKLEGSYIYSPYHRSLFRSLQDLLKLKRLTPEISYVFYTELPDHAILHEKGEEYTLLEINNRQFMAKPNFLKEPSTTVSNFLKDYQGGFSYV